MGNPILSDCVTVTDGRWRFRLFDNPLLEEANAFHKVDFSCDDWDEIEVPEGQRCALLIIVISSLWLSDIQIYVTSFFCLQNCLSQGVWAAGSRRLPNNPQTGNVSSALAYTACV